MRTIEQSIGAGKTITWQIVARYFRLINVSTAVDVAFYRRGEKVYEALAMESGLWVKPDGGFDRIDVTSAAAQNVKVAVSNGDAGYDRMTVDIASSVSIGDVVTNAAAVLVGVVATAIVTADATRRALRLHNAGTADVWIGGAGITAANGCIKLAPGDTWIEDNASAAAWYGVSGTAGQSIRVQEVR